ncbi:unnamed protein product, partial [Didymodactylos carnosus]
KYNNTEELCKLVPHVDDADVLYGEFLLVKKDVGECDSVQSIVN